MEQPINGATASSINNPFVTTAAGMYGGSNPLAPKLIVQGSITEGATLTFYVNGVKTTQTAAWHSGEVTELNLTATIEAPPPQPTPAPPAPTPPTPAPSVTAASPVPSAPPLPPAPSATAEPINWTVLWSIIGGAMVMTLIMLVIARSRAY